MTADPTALEHRLDPLVHPTNRLRICAALAAAQQVEFSVVQRAVGGSAGARCKHGHTQGEAR
jgi:hypothetical protein